MKYVKLNPGLSFEQNIMGLSLCDALYKVLSMLAHLFLERSFLLFKVFYHILACDRYHINQFIFHCSSYKSIFISMFLKDNIQNLVENGALLSEKSKFLFS